MHSISKHRAGTAPARGGRGAAIVAAAAVCLAAVVMVGLASAPLHAGVNLDKPVRVSTVKTDKSRVLGKITSYDDSGFDVTDDKGTAAAVKWSDLPARNVMEVYGALLAKGTVDDWIAAGKVMNHLPDGKTYAERAFARALRMDPKAKDKIEAAKTAPAPATEKPGDEAAPKDPRDRFWGKLTDEEQAEGIAELRKFAEATRKFKDGSLKPIETRFFLFYSDLKPDEAAKWAGLLDKMYARLAELFGVEKGVNLFRGKGLILVYSKEADYHGFERESHATDSTGTAGMCHSFGNGYVHIAFYRQPQELEFAHILVHESVHGFIHRYKSHENVPSWANEGLAEVIASELVPRAAETNARKATARSYVQERGVGGDFYATDHIAGWQYPVAEQLCAFMIQQNKRGYVSFINGIKDGLEIDDSFEKKYGATRDRVTDAFLRSMGAKPQ